MEDKPKVHIKDIVEGTELRSIATFTANGIRYWADRITIDQLATHADCEKCGNEFKKNYTYQKLCTNCAYIKKSEKYKELELVEWDGTTMLFLYDSDDQYFSDESEIEDYCEENETDIHSLKLVICQQTKFGQINIAEQFMDQLHEDWEVDGELLKLENQLNNYLRTASTGTWMPTNKRVSL